MTNMTFFAVQDYQSTILALSNKYGRYIISSVLLKSQHFLLFLCLGNAIVQTHQPRRWKPKAQNPSYLYNLCINPVIQI